MCRALCVVCTPVFGDNGGQPEGAAGPLRIDAGSGCGGRLPRGWQLSSCGGFLFAAASRFRVGHFLPSRPERVRCPHAGGLPMCVMWKNMYIEKHILHIIGIF